jgi:hypothetical protein
MDWRKYGVAAVLGLAAWLGSSAPARAEHKEYRIGEFSPEFRATLSIEVTGEVFEAGAVSVFERRSGKRLLHVTSRELSFDVENDEVPANIKEVPYGRQSVLIYEDFDFDGRPPSAALSSATSCTYPANHANRLESVPSRGIRPLESSVSATARTASSSTTGRKSSACPSRLAARSCSCPASKRAAAAP